MTEYMKSDTRAQMVNWLQNWRTTGKMKPEKKLFIAMTFPVTLPREDK